MHMTYPDSVTGAGPWPAPWIGDDGQTSARAVLAALRRRLRAAILIAGVTTALVVGILLILPRTWTSSTIFAPQAARTPGGSLGGLAAQFGISLPGGDAALSPAFYADLVKTKSFLLDVARSRVAVSRGDSVPVVTLLRVKGSTEPLRLDNAVRELDKRIITTAVQKTGVVRVGVTMDDATEAYGVTNNILRLIEAYNRRRRQSQAGSERTFTEARAQEANDELRAAEARLRDFLQANRSYGSATLRFEEARLERDITLRQQIYTLLAQSFEQAKIEEVRDTPLITIVDPPLVPARPDPRGLALKGIGALLLGGLFGIAGALLLDARAQRRAFAATAPGGPRA